MVILDRYMVIEVLIVVMKLFWYILIKLKYSKWYMEIKIFIFDVFRNGEVILSNVN